MTTENTGIVTRIFDEIFNSRALERMDAFAHDDLIVHYGGATGPLTGLAAYKASFAADLPSFPDASYAIDDLFGSADRVAIRWRMEATHQGTYLNYPPTGRRVALTGISIYRFVGGKVAECWVSADTHGFLGQLQPS